MNAPSPIAKAIERGRAMLQESLLRNGLYIMGTTAVTASFGFVFWLVAARALDADDVGRAAAIVSAMLFVAVFTNLGLGQVLISRLPRRAEGHDWSLTVTVALTATTISSLLGGAVAAALLPLLIPSLKGGVDTIAFLVLPFGVAGAACSLVLDFVFIAERHAKPSFLRNGAGSLLRVALIALVAAGPLESADGLLA